MPRYDNANREFRKRFGSEFYSPFGDQKEEKRFMNQIVRTAKKLEKSHSKSDAVKILLDMLAVMPISHIDEFVGNKVVACILLLKNTTHFKFLRYWLMRELKSGNAMKRWDIQVRRR
jgi:hypothetical protein